MRCLILTSTNNGDQRGFISSVAEGEEFEMVRMTDALPGHEFGDGGDQINESAPVFMVELPEGDFRPLLLDSEGEEIPLTFVD